MKPTFLGDVNFRRAILEGLERAEPLIETVNADEAGLNGLSDDIVLGIAASRGCILLTHDIRSMPKHFGEFILKRASSGVVVVKEQISNGAAIKEVLSLWIESEADEWIDRLKII